jgi:hypothetical protein
MAIILEPKSKSDVLPLGQKPEGDQFDNALIKLENTFSLLISKVNALEENLNKLQKTTERNCELIRTIVTFSDKLRWIPKDKDYVIALNPNMEKNDGHQ